MQIISKIDETRNIIKNWHKQDQVIGLVPTMGALHQGHKSLIKQAKKECDKVIISIFVNPTQFGANEDFDKYPKTFEQDKIACEKCGVDLIFSPLVSEMYPGFGANHKNNLLNKKNNTLVLPPLNYVNKLCGKSRPEHFDGVTTVVMKLFNIVQPDKAFFGQKDAQQLIIIKKMCADLNLPVEIVSCPIIREKDGMALSSRNSYLSVEDRKKGASLYIVLQNIKKMYNRGEINKKLVFEKAITSLDEAFELEYLVACDKNTLDELDMLRENAFIAIAARLSDVRLIDNIIL